MSFELMVELAQRLRTQQAARTGMDSLLHVVTGPVAHKAQRDAFLRIAETYVTETRRIAEIVQESGE